MSNSSWFPWGQPAQPKKKFQTEEEKLAEQNKLEAQKKLDEEKRLKEQARLAEQKQLEEEIRLKEEARLAEQKKLEVERLKGLRKNANAKFMAYNELGRELNSIVGTKDKPGIDVDQLIQDNTVKVARNNIIQLQPKVISLIKDFSTLEIDPADQNNLNTAIKGLNLYAKKLQLKLDEIDQKVTVHNQKVIAHNIVKINEIYNLLKKRSQAILGDIENDIPGINTADLSLELATEFKIVIPQLLLDIDERLGAISKLKVEPVAEAHKQEIIGTLNKYIVQLEAKANEINTAVASKIKEETEKKLKEEEKIANIMREEAEKHKIASKINKEPELPSITINQSMDNITQSGDGLNIKGSSDDEIIKTTSEPSEPSDLSSSNETLETLTSPTENLMRETSPNDPWAETSPDDVWPGISSHKVNRIESPKEMPTWLDEAEEKQDLLTNIQLPSEKDVLSIGVENPDTKPQEFVIEEASEPSITSLTFEHPLKKGLTNRLNELISLSNDLNNEIGQKIEDINIKKQFLSNLNNEIHNTNIFTINVEAMERALEKESTDFAKFLEDIDYTDLQNKKENFESQTEPFWDNYFEDISVFTEKDEEDLLVQLNNAPDNIEKNLNDLSKMSFENEFTTLNESLVEIAKLQGLYAGVTKFITEANISVEDTLANFKSWTEDVDNHWKDTTLEEKKEMIDAYSYEFNQVVDILKDFLSLVGKHVSKNFYGAESTQFMQGVLNNLNALDTKIDNAINHFSQTYTEFENRENAIEAMQGVEPLLPERVTSSVFSSPIETISAEEEEMANLLGRIYILKEKIRTRVGELRYADKIQDTQIALIECENEILDVEREIQATADLDIYGIRDRLEDLESRNTLIRKSAVDTNANIKVAHADKDLVNLKSELNRLKLSLSPVEANNAEVNRLLNECRGLVDSIRTYSWDPTSIISQTHENETTINNLLGSAELTKPLTSRRNDDYVSSSEEDEENDTLKTESLVETDSEDEEDKEDDALKKLEVVNDGGSDFSQYYSYLIKAKTDLLKTIINIPQQTAKMDGNQLNQRLEAINQLSSAKFDEITDIKDKFKVLIDDLNTALSQVSRDRNTTTTVTKNILIGASKLLSEIDQMQLKLSNLKKLTLKQINDRETKTKLYNKNTNETDRSYLESGQYSHVSHQVLEDIKAFITTDRSENHKKLKNHNNPDKRGQIDLYLAGIKGAEDLGALLTAIDANPRVNNVSPAMRQYMPKTIFALGKSTSDTYALGLKKELRDYIIRTYGINVYQKEEEKKYTNVNKKLG